MKKYLITIIFILISFYLVACKNDETIEPVYVGPMFLGLEVNHVIPQDHEIPDFLLNNESDYTETTNPSQYQVDFLGYVKDRVYITLYMMQIEFNHYTIQSVFINDVEYIIGEEEITFDGYPTGRFVQANQDNTRVHIPLILDYANKGLYEIEVTQITFIKDDVAHDVEGIEEQKNNLVIGILPRELTSGFTGRIAYTKEERKIVIANDTLLQTFNQDQALTHKIYINDLLATTFQTGTVIQGGYTYYIPETIDLGDADWVKITLEYEVLPNYYKKVSHFATLNRRIIPVTVESDFQDVLDLIDSSFNIAEDFSRESISFSLKNDIVLSEQFPNFSPYNLSISTSGFNIIYSEPVLFKVYNNLRLFDFNLDNDIVVHISSVDNLTKTITLISSKSIGEPYTLEIAEAFVEHITVTSEKMTGIYQVKFENFDDTGTVAIFTSVYLESFSFNIS